MYCVIYYLKKKKIKLLFLLLTFILLITPVYANPITKERNEGNYLIPNGIEVTEQNKNNILMTPAVDETEKVYDFADLFSSSEEEKLLKQISSYIDKYKMDLAVVTINENNKNSPQEYADDFYDYNAFGKGSNRDGILFLIDLQNREIYMTTTGYAINMYNDHRIDFSLEKVYKNMTNRDYYKGTSEYIKIISKYASLGLPSSKDRQVEKDILSTFLLSSMISLIITIIAMVILISKNKLVNKQETAEQYLQKESIQINDLGNILINSNTVRHYIDHDSSSGGGTSTHSGSSGISHGGGGHGF